VSCAGAQFEGCPEEI
jgi:hypothetical protein